MNQQEQHLADELEHGAALERGQRLEPSQRGFVPRQHSGHHHTRGRQLRRAALVVGVDLGERRDVPRHERKGEGRERDERGSPPSRRAHCGLGPTRRTPVRLEL